MGQRADKSLPASFIKQPRSPLIPRVSLAIRIGPLARNGDDENPDSVATRRKGLHRRHSE